MTPRDREIVRWIGRMGAVSLDNVSAHFGMGRTATYRRIAACISGGLVERVAILHDGPAFLTATRAGLRFAGLSLGMVRLTPALANHHRVCAEVAVWLERCHGSEAVMSVRELAFEERQRGRPIASAKVGELPNGAPRLHRPDFAVIGDSIRAIEVELTTKAPDRLERIVRAWRRARIDEIDYVCEAGAVRRAVERAIARTRAEHKVRLIAVEEVLECSK